MKNSNNYFSMAQVTKCCGISRATILRLESKGLLTPARINESSGYRYYDNHNIMKILQIKNFLNMGMSYSDVQLYFSSGGASHKLLQKLEEKFYATKRTYEEMQFRMENKEDVSFEFVSLPEYVCYTREFEGCSIKEKYDAMYGLFHETVEQGYRPLPSEPLFVINKNTDIFRGDHDNGNGFICCIPLEPDSTPENAVVYPSCRAFSLVSYGGYERLPEIYDRLSRKIRELELKPIGYPRGLGIVAPYTSKDFQSNRYVSRIAVPIE